MNAARTVLLMFWFTILSFQNQGEDRSCSQTQCYKSYQSCEACVQDPCSRREANFASEDKCVWCADLSSFPDPNKSNRGCIPRNYENLCSSDSLAVRTVECPSSARAEKRFQARESEESGCGHLVNDDESFALDLTYNNDINVVTSTVSGTGFETWVHLCSKVQDETFATTCQQTSPIAIIERLNTGSYMNTFCWNLGSEEVYPFWKSAHLDKKTLETGVPIDYGVGYCCPGNSTGPGQSKEFDIKLIIKPNCGANAEWKLEPIDYNFLTNCSASELNVTLLSPATCKENFLWRLSTDKTAATCRLPDPEVFNCSINPTSVVNYEITSCSGFILLKKFLSGSVEHSAINSSCNFSIPIQDDLCSFGINYTFPSSPPKVILINGNDTLQLNCSAERTSYHHRGRKVVGLVAVLMVVLLCYLLSELLQR